MVRALSEAPLPGSKSHAQRALLLAGLGGGKTLVENVPDSADLRVTEAVLRSLGATVERDGTTLQVRPVGSLPREVALHLGENGTALRMVSVLLPLLGVTVDLDGDPGLRRRPLTPVLAFLERCGIGRSEGDTLPLQVEGAGPIAGPLQIDGRLSTQPASGVLLALALGQLWRPDSLPSRLRVEAPSAEGYLQVTRRVLEDFGWSSRMEPALADREYRLEGRQFDPAGSATYRVPPDASSSAFVWAMYGIWDLPLPDSTGSDGHPDWDAWHHFDGMRSADPTSEFRVRRLAGTPDAFPALCAVAALRPGPTTLRGAPALRAKESDRIAAMAAGLQALGVQVEEHPDGLVIAGPLRAPSGTEPVPVPATADHRVVMALALLGCFVPQGVRLEPDTAVAKSWPGFWGWLRTVAAVETV